MKNNDSSLDNMEIESKLIFDTLSFSEDIFITFFIPTFRRVDTLKSALESIYSVTGLEKINYEVIVVDNSADFSLENPTRKFLSGQSYKNFRYFINEKNIGMEGNWNRGIWLAQGKFVSILHDDDLLAECYLQEILEKFNSIEDLDQLGFIRVKYSIFENENELTTLNNENNILEKCSLLETTLLGLGPTWTPSCGMIFSREAVINVSGFKSELHPSADHEIGIRILNNGYMGYRTSKPLAYYRIGVNESMKLDTIKEFIKKDTIIRQYIYSKVWYGSIFKLLFEKVLYSERISFWINYAEEKFNNEIPVESLDYENTYGKYPITGLLLRLFRKLYRVIVHRERLLRRYRR